MDTGSKLCITCFIVTIISVYVGVGELNLDKYPDLTPVFDPDTETHSTRYVVEIDGEEHPVVVKEGKYHPGTQEGVLISIVGGLGPLGVAFYITTCREDLWYDDEKEVKTNE